MARLRIRTVVWHIAVYRNMWAARYLVNQFSIPCSMVIGTRVADDARWLIVRTLAKAVLLLY